MTAWYGWGDYVIPDIYTSMRDDLTAIRTRAALIDMSPLPKTEFRGPDAAHLLDRLMTRPIAPLGVGRCLYSPWCNADGALVGDVLIFRLAEDRFFVAGENSQTWFESHRGALRTEIVDITDAFGILSVQGPRSGEVVARAAGAGWAEIGFSELAFHRIAGHDVIVARQGFTGEKGYEIWTPRIGGADVWRSVMAAGRSAGAPPAGEYAIDIARVEAGLILVSADYSGAGPDAKTANVAVDTSLRITPFEAGLGRLVDLDGARVFWGSRGVFQHGQRVGRSSSLCWSPSLGGPIAFGFIDGTCARKGDPVEVELVRPDGTPVGRVPASLVETPFIELRRTA